MAKIRVVHAKPVSSFNSDWLRDTFNQYLAFEPWDPQQRYPTGTVFYLNCLDFPTHNNVLPATPQQLAEQGFRVVVDNLWEVNPGPEPYALRICCPAWFWYNESMWYQHLGYEKYQPCYRPQYLALMPMRLAREHRVDFVQAMEDLLPQMIWSFVDQGRQLPGDGDMTDWNTQRYFNPDWYDQTYVNMVVETLVRPGSKHTPIFITEKTTKPLAFQQPLIVYGNRGTLRTLRSWGFETFDNLWDESYDEIVDPIQRRDAVIQLLRELTVEQHSAETLRRLQHNRNHFYNRELIIDRVVKEIIEPIIEYAETR